jgi:hypothetical protein
MPTEHPEERVVLRFCESEFYYMHVNPILEHLVNHLGPHIAEKIWKHLIPKERHYLTPGLKEVEEKISTLRARHGEKPVEGKGFRMYMPYDEATKREMSQLLKEHNELMREEWKTVDKTKKWLRISILFGLPILLFLLYRFIVFLR